MDDWLLECTNAGQADEYGKFFIYREFSDREAIEVFARAQGNAASQVINVPKGSEDLVLTLGASGSLTAKVKVPRTPAAREFFVFRLIPENGENHPGFPRPKKSYEAGVLEVSWPDIPQGSYSLEVMNRDLQHYKFSPDSHKTGPSHERLNQMIADADLLTTKLQRIVVEDDSLLLNLDLTTRWKALRFEVKDEAGKLIASAFSEAIIGDLEYFGFENKEPGITEILVPHQDAKVRVSANGFAPQLVSPNTPHQIVIMGKAAEIEVVLVDLPRNTVRVAAQLNGPTGEIHLLFEPTGTRGRFTSTTAACGIGEHTLTVHYTLERGVAVEETGSEEATPQMKATSEGVTLRMKGTPRIEVRSKQGLQVFRFSAAQ